MSVRMIMLLGIFVWAPMMGYLGWKYLQTFDTIKRSRSRVRRARRDPQPLNGGHLLHDESRRRVRRSF